jgi:hypothetical protein
MHSTNYTNTFIAVADDCSSQTGALPPEKPEPTVARMQFEMIHAHPYRYTSDEVLFAIYALRNRIEPEAMESQRAAFFAKGQPCLRSSPLGKRYGWGIHFDGEARVALYACESDDYARLQGDLTLKQLKAMKSAR